MVVSANLDVIVYMVECSFNKAILAVLKVMINLPCTNTKGQNVPLTVRVTDVIANVALKSVPSS
jgi:hypothetical protein